MSGYQVWNSAGALVIDSDFKGTYYQDAVNYAGITDIGYYDISCQLGNSTDMGHVSASVPLDDSLRWFKPNNNAKMFFTGPDWMTANAGSMAHTRSDMPVESGYRDVFNSAGQLVWSAVMAAKIPRILGFFDVPANFDLDNTVYSQYIGTNTWFLISSVPGGNISDDGSVTGFSGPFFRFINGTLQCQWVNRNQQAWANTLKPYGMRIPYGILSNLS
ncbi:hypothetical protein SOM38_10520 [Pantoea agglomerans]|uniref:hypothetical protein n=1 Tax=Enterobacter agglomerans TaxID=549 RepID=UPI002A6B47CD|nr:hypothetical protein [Pantoea agglomerans]MDY0994544.1 hypothetical protein [Pantoea agglomerans]